MSDRDLMHLEPSVRARFLAGVALYDRTKTRPFTIRAMETWRSASDQIAAQASGASSRQPGGSFHNITKRGLPYAYAIDFQLAREDGHLLSGTTHADELAYQEAAACFKRVGFRWSGDWKDHHPNEVGHIEAPTTIPRAWAGEEPNWPELPEGQ